MDGHSADGIWGEVLPAIDHASAHKGRRLHGWIGARSNPYDPIRYERDSNLWTPPEKREWWVYFIQGDDGGPIKIGRTTNLMDRLCGVGGGYPFGRLRYVGLILANGALEKELHARFSGLRLRGEWFRPGAELVAFIRGMEAP